MPSTGKQFLVRATSKVLAFAGGIVVGWCVMGAQYLAAALAFVAVVLVVAALDSIS